ncbi:hypothetical protein NUU61_000897 [Penicillium alfredii]|uniref:FHA domain-containing protein n=1 Tax=Penicillium alfredii TaxID=1506179 RepID=A0A9W9KRH5_9EURO|nr:uncharacterized protein NUU61_000897 [Penicillium alfredii]KAJ5115138.1 hypothetical protein NUU61_000897 [Penicillium alfredii]
MPGEQVSVSLVPLFADTPPLRTITLSEDNPNVSIGRASRREIKNRFPAKENGWFDSRVMSREHAELSFCAKTRTVYICDYESTHGTWLNNAKMVTGEKTPLLSGDLLRFGVDVNRFDEVFPAFSVRCHIDWPHTQYENLPLQYHTLVSNIVISSQEQTPDSSVDGSKSKTSTNTFCVPEDEESEDDVSTGSLSNEVDAIPGEHSDTSDELPSSSSDAKSRPNFWLLPSSRLNITGAIEAKVEAELPKCTDKSGTEPEESIQTKSAGLSTPMETPTQSDALRTASPKETYRNAPEIYYDVPEKGFEDWVMLKPGFMRAADIRWGECDSLPNIDPEEQIIHAARRCFVPENTYFVGDDPKDKPITGTECAWQLSPEHSDVNFHAVSEVGLQYWFVDTRKYWVIWEEGNGFPRGWWLVEKPLEFISEDVKSQFQHESAIEDWNKCWIVPAWLPELFGQNCREGTPHCDPEFIEAPFVKGTGRFDLDEEEDPDWDSDASSIDVSVSEHLEDSEDEDSSHSFNDLASRAEIAGLYTETALALEFKSDGNSDDENAGHDEEAFIDPAKLTRDTATSPISSETTESDKTSSTGPKPAASNADGTALTDPRARFPQYPVTRVLAPVDPESHACTENVDPAFALSRSITPHVSYSDGPFAKAKITTPKLQINQEQTPALKGSLKRKAPEMESEMDPSELQASSESDIADAISSALSESEPPRKRVKPGHSSLSRNLASHAATAIISAVLGGLGTIAALAALPPDYFS